MTTAQILPTGVSQIRGGVQEATLAAAKKYVSNLQAQYNFLHSEATQNQGTGANGVGPSGTIPNITAPPTTTTTTTVPGATTAPIATTTTPAVTPP